MRLVSTVAVVLRRLRAERAVVLTLFVLVAVTSLVASVSPRLFERVADEGLRYAVSQGTALQQTLQFSSVDQIRPGDPDPLSFVAGRGDILMDRVPDSVRGVLSGNDVVIETPRFALDEPPNYPAFVTLRFQDHIDGRLIMERGRAPAAVDRPAGDEPQRFEIALSSAAAAELLVDVEDNLSATVDPSDPMIRRLFPRPTATIELAVVGLFTVTDPDDPAWLDDPAFARAAVGGTEDAPVAFANALIAPEAYVDVADLGLPSRYRWRYQVDAGGLDAGALETLIPDLRRLDAAFGADRSVPGRPVYRSGLPDVIERYRAERATTEAVLSVAAIGPLAVASGALGLVAVIVIRRRRASLALSRSRGASAGQLLAAQLWEGLLITVPAAGAGLLAARLVVPARSDPMSSAAAALVAAVVTLLLLLATWPRARRARREADRDDAPVQRLSPRRIVFEVTVVAVAIAAAVLLRQRGLGAGRAGSDASAPDPLLVATPVLLGVATALLVIRLYPVPVRVLAWLSARRRDLVPSLGLRSIGRDPSAARLPLMVVTLTVAIGVFSSVVALTIASGQERAAWQEVGADYRIAAADATGLGRDVDPSTVPGVEATASGLIAQTSPIAGVSERTDAVTLLAVDAEPYAQVLAGSPLARPVPLEFIDPPAGSDTGTPERPIPAIVSRRLPPSWAPLPIGEPFRVGFRATAMTFVVVGLADDAPGIPSSRPFLIVPFQSLAAASSGPTLRPNHAFVRAPASVEPELRSALAASGAELTSRRALLAGRQAAPLVGAIGAGFGLAVILAAVYAALAIVAMITLDAQRRSRELAYLRTLGFSSRQSLGLTVVEHAPPTLLALGVGVLLGLAVAWLLEPGLGLGAFIGSAATVRLEVDWAAIGAIAATVLVVIGLMVVISSWLAQRFDAGQALRIGDA